MPVDLSKLTPDERMRLHALLKLREKLKAENQLASFSPYPKQLEFFAAGNVRGVRERLLMAGNQLGKCCTVSSYVDLPDGGRATFGELYRRGVPFEVNAWDGERVVRAWAVSPIRKPAQPCLRLWFEDGRWIEVAHRHRMLTTAGWAFAEDVVRLPASERDLLGSSSAPSRSARASGASCWSRTLRGFLSGCLAGCRFGDARLHAARGAVRAWLLRQADAQVRTLALSCAGGSGARHTRTLRQGVGHPSSSDAPGLTGGRFVASSTQAVDTFFRWCTERLQGAQRRLVAAALRLRSDDAEGLRPVQSCALVSPEGNRIVAYERIARQEVYDFTVPRYENYLAAGVIHHNTLAGGAETAMHLLGEYPDWWPGRRFTKPTRGWYAGVTGESTRDNPQRVLLGTTDAWGTGMIPKSRLVRPQRAVHGVADLVDSIQVRHVSGGISTVYAKSYEKGRQKWQGETLDFVWFDEEPPLDVYSEGVTRTQATGGLVYVTFTPLQGLSDTVARFLLHKTPGTHVTTMTIEDAAHYTPEQRAAIIAGYPAHEREARARGIPVLGSGKIFPVEESLITEGVLQIPRHWPRIAGIDFGWTHPTAVVWAAWDRESDTIHIYDCYRVSEQPPIIHAAAIKARGPWIPVAWPHDGENETSAGEGTALAAKYRALEVRMLRERAQYPDKSISTERANLDLLERMQQGRFRVASHLSDWFEEFRLYHRKDGKIVKVRDDLISATQKIVMSLRHADVPPSLSAMRPGQTTLVLDPTVGL